MITREQIVTTARSYIGVPYRHQGRKRSTGVDCIGFIWAVSQELGYAPPIAQNYSRFPTGTLLMSEVSKYLIPTDRTKVTELQPGDITVLRGLDNEPQHFAIVGWYGEYPTMIHSAMKLKRVTEHSWDRFWTPRILGVYELPDTVQALAPTEG